MKRSAVHTDPSGWCQRSSASTATTAPVERSISGWYQTASCFRSSACLRSVSMAMCVVAAARRSSLKTATRSRPESFAAYIAVSASRSRSPALPAPPDGATPMLTVE